ncbi:hypothetical protein H6P81_007373 [Aristolochia fimbriata]|uniref:Cation/H+ exchanger domain-containing protein n=1 Tax=Aristolochia fimbriata TaxID=158543 RepID=A0AAV7F0N4_ARIFI|nr:hypothetical protein H6P81_007373 [Aristolochia fimbriata]
MKISNSTTAGTAGSESSVCYITLDSPWSDSIFSRHNPLHTTASLLLLQMCLILSLTGLVRLILRPLKQPAIISDVLAGIIIGPSGLGRYPMFQKELFPPHTWTATRTFGIIGVLFHVFNEVLKEDLHYVLNSGRKEVVISLSGYFVSNFSSFVLGRCLMHFGYLPKNINRMHLLDSLSGVLALTTFPVLRPILSEFNLSTSQLGRLSMTLAVINTLLGTILTIVYSSIRHGNMHKGESVVGIYHFASHVALFILLLTLVRPLMMWFIKKAKEGRRMPSGFLNLSMLVVLLTGMLSDMLGTVVKAPIWLAFMIPTGPPLASALIEKTELVCRTLFVPFFFVTNGQQFNIWGIFRDWKTFWCLQLFFFTACLGKFLGTLLPALYFKMPFRDSLGLALAMCVKGIMELVTFTDWLHLNMLDTSQLAGLELSLLGVTAIATPCLRLLGRQRRPRSWNSNHWRCIAQSQPETEFRLLVCIHDKEDVPTMLHLANCNYHATKKNPTQLFTLHLVDLIGRGIPILICHKKSNQSQRLIPSKEGKQLDPIFSSFMKLERHSHGGLVVRPFTSVSLYKAMHEDVCKVALDNKVSLVIVPFWKDTLMYSTTHINVGSDHGIRQGRNIVVRKMLEEAPCSVGVLVDNDCSRTSCLVGSFHIALVFLGGPDDREALAYASLMVDNPGVKVTLLRCNLLSDHDEGFNVEKVLDDECIGEFKLKTCSHEGTVYYKEAFATRVEELVSSIRAIGTDFNLMITGRKHTRHSKVEVGLSTWSETEELGVIGDFLSSTDFAANAISVLVIQQRSMMPLLAIHANNASSRQSNR